MATDPNQLQLLLDHAAISGVQLRYATAVDSRDWRLLRSCFTDDIETGSAESAGSAPQRIKADDWVELVRRTISGMHATQHLITNHVITLDGNAAICVAYVQARHHLLNETGGGDQVMYGYYTNRFVRTPDGWKIRTRQLTVTWNEGNMRIFELARRRLDQAEGRHRGKK
jgi:ketosteroid isomerase-like protein